MSLYCQSCNRVLYNRRLRRCGFCGADIPEELRFTPAEIAAIEHKMVELEESRKQRQLAAEAACNAQAQSFILIPIIMSGS